MSQYTSNSQGKLLMSSLQVFFKDKGNLDKIIPIINGESKISLRVTDWFVTNYSKKFNTSYFVKTDDNTILGEDEDYNPSTCKEFLVYQDYKLQLKGYSKKQFDPFCRRSRTNFFYSETESFVTTVGQLNFFRWIINNKILDYITNNLKIIDQDMNSCYKAHYNSSKESKQKGKNRRKRKELSISASKSMSKSKVKVVVSFD